ncbi:hypothetical protein HYW73_00325 [Candidatus Nomurabacteria bacterium]|nr:hypothetical protein [Candidatus Nomurabacteria bacterium]
MKIEIFKNKKKFKKGGFHTNPNIGWEIILLITFILVVLSLAFGVYLFVRTNEEFGASATNGSSQVKIVKKDRIEKALQYFSLRGQKSKEILNSPSPVIDPSL